MTFVLSMFFPLQLIRYLLSFISLHRFFFLCLSSLRPLKGNILFVQIFILLPFFQESGTHSLFKNTVDDFNAGDDFNAEVKTILSR